MATSDQGDAIFRFGTPLMLPIVPDAEIPPGAVYVDPTGVKPYVCHTGMAAGEKGTLAGGGGVYEMTTDGSGVAGGPVYWDETAKKVTASAAGNTHFGYHMPGMGAIQADDRIHVEHCPNLLASG